MCLFSLNKKPKEIEKKIIPTEVTVTVNWGKKNGFVGFPYNFKRRSNQKLEMNVGLQEIIDIV